MSKHLPCSYDISRLVKEFTELLMVDEDTKSFLRMFRLMFFKVIDQDYLYQFLRSGVSSLHIFFLEIKNMSKLDTVIPNLL